jgi:hypothetical protein
MPIYCGRHDPHLARQTGHVQPLKAIPRDQRQRRPGNLVLANLGVRFGSTHIVTVRSQYGPVKLAGLDLNQGFSPTFRRNGFKLRLVQDEDIVLAAELRMIPCQTTASPSIGPAQRCIMAGPT